VAKSKFTRIPKIPDLVAQGVPYYTIGTFCALTDHANNKNQLCWPSMTRLSKILGCSIRTVQRHLRILEQCGLVQFVERRRNKGRYSSYLYKILFQPTTGHGRSVEKRGSINNRTKRTTKAPKPLKKTREDYAWWFK
jgi:DNA-binding transcriptional ArsR family regulator